jgi:hypothetical protein
MGRRQSGLSRAAICVLGEDDLERMVILDSFARRIPPDLYINKIFEVNERWRPAVFGVDATGPQLAFYQILLKEARERAVKWNPRPIALRIDKIDTIEKTIQPIAAAGRLLRPPERDCNALAEEWRQFPTGQYLDAMDCLAQCVRLMPTVLPAHMKLMGEKQLRDHLARMGFRPEQIAERIAQRDQFR